MAEIPRKPPKVAGTPEPVPKEPAAEQPAGAFHENRPQESPAPTGSIADRLRPGKLFASFELERELESGSTGTVWLAQDYSVRRQVEQVALWFLPDCIVGDRAAVEELKNKIRRRIALKHPNILRTYDLVESRGRVAIQMEYLDGQSLSSLRLTRPNQVFEVRELEKWVKQLCEALEYAHKDAGLVGGHIVPGNLIVNRAGNLKLKDFGTANCIAGSMNRLRAIHDPDETLPYRSPERAAGAEPAITDDLYSLGATLYELLTSKPPFYAGDIGVQVSGKIPPPMAERRAELGIEGEAIPENWEETVAACLAKDPVQRPQSAIEVEKRLPNTTAPPDIPDASTSKSVPDSVTEPPPPVRPPPTRRPWLVILGITFILAYVSATVLFVFHEKFFRHTHLIPIKEPSPSPTVPPPPSESAGKKTALSMSTPSPEVSPTPSPEVRPTPSPEVRPTPSPEVSPTPSPEVNPTPSPEVSPTPSQQKSALPNERQSQGPSSKPLSQQDIDATKEDVVTRINALPGITAGKRANLIEKMNKARSMERLIVIPFESGRTSLRRAATRELVNAFDTPEMRDKLSDPTIILVVAGYADTGGRAEINLHISQERAENVSRILKERVMLLNAVQTIGMGGTELLDSKRPDQNRAVEVWAVVPL
jgi:outer membrane protein OmpA-like peptidoglycan-associated protein